MYSTSPVIMLLSIRFPSTQKAFSFLVVSRPASLAFHFLSQFSPQCSGDNGTLTFWDYNTGTPFQNLDDVPQPGSLEAEAGIFCSTFDITGTRLITGGADKTIKVGRGQLTTQIIIIHWSSHAGLCRAVTIIAIRMMFIIQLCCNIVLCLLPSYYRLHRLFLSSTDEVHEVNGVRRFAFIPDQL